MEHLVPAVVAEAVREQGGQGRFAGTVILRLDGGRLQRTVSCAGL
jgi:hypothetical protein